MTKKLIMIIGLVLSSMLMKAQAFFVPFPKAGDKYWQKQVPVAMRNDYIRLGNLYQKKPWNAIPAETFAEFRTNGNRTRYEEASFGIRKQFVCLVMAEIMQGRGRFLPSIRKGLHYFIEKEPWWGIPAHYPKDHPEKDIQPVDLFNAETAGMLAWTLYMLEDEINRKEKGLCDRVRSEIPATGVEPAAGLEEQCQQLEYLDYEQLVGNGIDLRIRCQAARCCLQGSAAVSANLPEGLSR
jgi:hypothetical protein